MEDKKPNLIIIGGGHNSGLLAIAEMELKSHNVEIVTIDEVMALA